MNAEEAGDRLAAARHYREAARVHTDPERAAVYVAEAERLEAALAA
jgi:hypothetical protein